MTRRQKVIRVDTGRRVTGNNHNEKRGGYTTLVCLNRQHPDPVEYEVKTGDPNTCPACGRGN